jgi:hypothetical protein
MRSVADPGCVSRILNFTHPGSRISDPKTATKDNFLPYLFCSHKFHKIANFLIFYAEGKILVQCKKIIELFTQKIVTKLSKIWVWDPGSEIRKKPIPDQGSRGQNGNRIPDPQHCMRSKRTAIESKGG